jgi:hypothetical protein
MAQRYTSISDYALALYPQVEVTTISKTFGRGLIARRDFVVSIALHSASAFVHQR